MDSGTNLKRSNGSLRRMLSKIGGKYGVCERVFKITQRHTLDEHIDVHEAQRLSVHVEAFGADGRKAVHLLQVPQPHQDVLT